MKIEAKIWGKERKAKTLRYGRLYDSEPREDDRHIDLKGFFTYGDWVEREKVRPLCACFGKKGCKCARRVKELQESVRKGGGRNGG